MHRISVLQQIIDATKARTYLEIGVEYGTVFFALHSLNQRIAVDPVFKVSWRKKLLHPLITLESQFFQEPSDHFFEQHSTILPKQGLDLVFIDGLHTYEQSLRDLEHSLKYLHPQGIIVMHDCNPITPLQASKTIEEARGAWCGDVWKTIVYTRSQNPGVQAFVLDADYGLGIIRKQKPLHEPLSLSTDDIQHMTYDDLETHRERLLGLTSASYFGEFVKTLRPIH